MIDYVSFETKILSITRILFSSVNHYSQTEYNVYRIVFGALDKSTNKYKTVETVNVNTTAFWKNECY